MVSPKLQVPTVDAQSDPVAHHTLEALSVTPEDGQPYTGLFFKDGIEIADNIATHEHFAAEMVKRWNAHTDLLEALEHLNGHWKASEATGDPDYALDLGTCEICRNMVRDAIAKAR